MAEITKINIKGVDYDIGGTGGGANIKYITLPTDTNLYELKVLNDYFADDFSSLDKYDKIVFSINRTDSGLADLVEVKMTFNKQQVVIVEGETLVSLFVCISSNMEGGDLELWTITNFGNWVALANTPLSTQTTTTQ